MKYDTASYNTANGLSATYHENTKLHRHVHRTLPNEIELSAAEQAVLARSYKEFSSHPKIRLTDRAGVDSGLQNALSARRSRRQFSDRPVNLDALSALLRWSAGVSATVSTLPNVDQYLRYWPSAGGLYPVEIYVVVRNVVGIDPGVYHFNPITADLAHLSSDLSLFHPAACYEPATQSCAFALAFTGVFARTKAKYGERGYRYVLLDAGHLGQNFALNAAALGLANFTSCGFFDDDLNAILGIDGLEESSLFLSYFGSREE